MPTCVNCLAENPEQARFCLACGTSLQTAVAGESRRLVTIVFCDLEDSTPLSVRMDAESLRKVITRYFEEMRTAVERHGGTVEKFIGDAVMAVFGVPQLHEDDALRAVRAAIDMRDALDLLNTELEPAWGVTLRSRIGVNSGQVVAGDPLGGQAFVTGEPVNLASRLEAAAAPGMILLGDATYRLVRDAVSVEELQLAGLKGLGDVKAHRLLEMKTDTTGHTPRLFSPLVDRERELVLLEEFSERSIVSRRCQAFTILGSAGIGKSRLVEEFLSSLDDGVTVLRGRCLPYGEGITYWPIVETVRQAAQITDQDGEKDVSVKIAKLLLNDRNGELIADRLAQAIGVAGPTTVAEETFWAIRAFFESLARGRSLVLVFDDLQWAEPTFLDLLEHIAEWSRDVPITLVCIARPELLEVRRSWGGGSLNAISVLLEPLTEDDSAQLMRNLLGTGGLDPDVRARVSEVGAGNPLFVEEMLSMLIDDELLVRTEQGWVASPRLNEVALPPTISVLLAARLDRLTPKERVAIECASVVGEEFSLSELTALLPPGLAADAAELLGSLSRKELIRPAGAPGPEALAFRFRHILIMDAAYESVPKRTRAELHERYAGWLEEHGTQRREEIEEILGYHLEQAHRYGTEVGPTDDRASELARRAGLTLAAAGRKAAARGDASAAVNLLGRAARLLPLGDPTRHEMLPSLYDSLIDVGAMDEAGSMLDEILEVARERGDPVLETRAKVDARFWEFVRNPGGTDVDTLRRELEEAATLFRDLDNSWNLAIVLDSLATVHWVAGAAAAMLDASERGLELARNAGNRRMVARSASNLAAALLIGPTPYPQALARLEELADELADDRLAQSTVRCLLALVLGSLGRFERAREQAAEARAVFSDLGQPRWLAHVSSMVGLVSLAEGLLAESETELRAAYRFFRDQRDTLNAPLIACDLSRVLLLQGHDDESDALAVEAAETGTIDLEPQVRWRGVRALVLARRGEVKEAETLAREALALVAPTDFVALRADASMDLAEVLRLAGRADEARALIAEAISLYEAKGDVVGARLARHIGDGASTGPQGSAADEL